MEAVVAGDVPALRRIADQTPWQLRRRESDMTPLHTALLRSASSPVHRDTAAWLVNLLPHLSLDVVTGGIFAGASSLHFPIIHRSPGLVRLIADSCPSLLRQRATGEFFSRGAMFLGETPLHFAVATNQPDVVAYLLEVGAQRLGKAEGELLDVRTGAGDTVCHICVHNNLPQMYDYLMLLAEKFSPQWHVDGVHAAFNADGYNPFTLASHLGHREMFQHLLNRLTEHEWAMGPCQCRRLWLDDLDPADSRRTGAMQILVDREHSELIMLPAVSELLQVKWDAFARELATIELYGTCAYIAAFSVAVFYRPLLRQQAETDEYCREDLWVGAPLKDKLLFGVYCGMGAYPALKFSEAVIILGVILFVSGEVRQLAKTPLRQHFGRKGTLRMEMLVRYAYCTAIGFAALWRCLSDAAREDLSLACAALLLWTMMLHQLLGFRGTGPFVIMIWKMLGSDLIRFLVIFCAFLFGFTEALYLLMNKYGSKSLMERLLGCFVALLGQADVSALIVDGDASPYPIFSTVLLLVYVLMVSVLLLNLLIAMMTTTYSKVYDVSDKVWSLEWARKIIAIEQRLSAGDRIRYRYWGEALRGGAKRRFILLPATREEDRTRYRSQPVVWPAHTPPSIMLG
eukprot:TRINITY_DN3074_c0_g1_i5.p1 TRINITY_DN3074_c0_g1~~TRINITY_DN3074_c0_g1_i5.p1  ORF type:complete len:628 (+),score=199.83 TRINITY_DN3074_c0_g1_i5:133-2016(+)